MSVVSGNNSTTNTTNTSTNKVVKTLPIKYKCILFGMVGFMEKLKSSDLLGEEEVEKCYALFKDVIFKTPSEQIDFLDNFIDPVYIEKTVIKSMIQQNKQELKAAEKEAKKAEKKAERAAAKEAAKAGEPKKETKPRKPKAKKTESQTESQTENNQTENGDIEPASSQESKLTIEIPSDISENDNSDASDDNKQTDAHMRIINNQKYWIIESAPNEEIVHENVTDEDGDNTSGKRVGILNNGELQLDAVVVEEDKPKKKTTKRKAEGDKPTTGKKPAAPKKQPKKKDGNTTPLLTKEAIEETKRTMETTDIYELKEEEYVENPNSTKQKSDSGKLKVNK